MVIDSNLIPSVSIEAMLMTKQLALEKVDQALRLLDEAQDLTVKFGMGNIEDWLIHKHNSVYCSPIFSDNRLYKVEQDMDRCGWQYLMEQSGLITFMDAKRRNQWRETLNDERQELPKLDKNNIAHTFEELYSKRIEMFEDGVINVFKRLSWNYKTNSPCLFVCLVRKSLWITWLNIILNGAFLIPIVNQGINWVIWKGLCLCLMVSLNLITELIWQRSLLNLSVVKIIFLKMICLL